MASQSINQSINESSVPLQEIASTQSSALYVFVLHIATYSLLKVLTPSLPWAPPWPFPCYIFFIKTLFTNLSSSTCSSFSPHAFCFAFTTSGTASCVSACCLASSFITQAASHLLLSVDISFPVLAAYSHASSVVSMLHNHTAMLVEL